MGIRDILRSEESLRRSRLPGCNETMRTARELTKSVAVPAVLLASWLTATVALSADRVADQAPSDDANCQLKIGATSVTRLTLVDESGKYRVINRPRQSVSLPPGKYRLDEIELRGDYQSCQFRGRDDQWFELTPDRPHQLRVDGLMTPTVEVTRHGRLLELSYSLSDANGAMYSRRDRENPPRFTVYKDGEEIGSGSFEYG